MSQMRFSGRFIMSLTLTAISLTVVLIAMQWPFKAALFPVSIGIAVFSLSLATSILILTGKGGSSGKRAAVDFQLSDDVDEATATRRTLGAFAWIIGFLLLIILLGFSISIPLFVFLYAKFQGREKWWVSIALTFFSWFFFWGLFVWLLDIGLQDGLIQQGLKLLGIG
jgi:Tripartite tricarboxylate transporter TctB family